MQHSLISLGLKKNLQPRKQRQIDSEPRNSKTSLPLCSAFRLFLMKEPCMKNFFASLPCLLLILALPLEVFAMPPKSKEPETCQQKLLITRTDCPWVGMTDSYEKEQATKLVKAHALGSTHTPFAALKAFDQPDVLLAKDAHLKEVHISERYFSGLRRGDATRLGKGIEHQIGTFRDLSFKRLGPRQLVLFLLQAQIIETYWHLEAELCMVSEEDKPESYRAQFHGVHRYCTNSCEEDAFAFTVNINKKTGGLSLIGGN